MFPNEQHSFACLHGVGIRLAIVSTTSFWHSARGDCALFQGFHGATSGQGERLVKPLQVPPIGKEEDLLEKLFYQTVGLIFC
jgi:hypothetical protein